MIKYVRHRLLIEKQCSQEAVEVAKEEEEVQEEEVEEIDIEREDQRELQLASVTA